MYVYDDVRTYRINKECSLVDLQGLLYQVRSELKQETLFRPK